MSKIDGEVPVAACITIITESGRYVLEGEGDYSAIVAALTSPTGIGS